jgi:tripartite-type tricarboxylate transporter receptor subunit TctC
VPTFKELGVDWVDGAFRGIGVPKATPPEARTPAEMFATLNADPEMKELAAKAGFELVNVGVDGMDAFMRPDAHLHRRRHAHGAGGKK